MCIRDRSSRPRRRRQHPGRFAAGRCPAHRRCTTAGEYGCAAGNMPPPAGPGTGGSGAIAFSSYPRTSFVGYPHYIQSHASCRLQKRHLSKCYSHHIFCNIYFTFSSIYHIMHIERRRLYK